MASVDTQLKATQFMDNKKMIKHTFVTKQVVDVEIELPYFFKYVETNTAGKYIIFGVAYNDGINIIEYTTIFGFRMDSYHIFQVNYNDYYISKIVDQHNKSTEEEYTSAKLLAIEFIKNHK